MFKANQRRQAQKITVHIAVIGQKIGDRQTQHRILAPGNTLSCHNRGVIHFRHGNPGGCFGNTPLTVLHPIGEAGFAMEVGIRAEDHLAILNRGRSTSYRRNCRQ